MNSTEIPYQKQIFVCTNDRKGEKPSCGDQNGEAVFTELRRIAKEKGLHPRIRVARAKCLGQCAQGVTVMVYQSRASEPDGKWFKNVTPEDVPELAKLYLSGVLP